MTELACSYTHVDGTKCNRTLFTSDHVTKTCLFHQPIDSMRKSEQFEKEFNQLVQEKDGNWEGFIFPEDFKINYSSIAFSINCRNAVFQDILIVKTVFQESVDFSGIVFEGSLLFDSATKFQKNITFHNARFIGKTMFRCLFKGSVNFNSTIFSDSAIFSGTQHCNLNIGCDTVFLNSSISGNVVKSYPADITSWEIIKILHEKLILRINHYFKSIKNFIITTVTFTFEKVKTKIFPENPYEIRRVFNNEVHFQSVEFEKPDRVKFQMVDLSRAHITMTMFRGVSFVDVVWNKYHSRKIIYDEVVINESTDKNFKKNRLPHLAEAYRNLRVTLEDNKDYSTASDFYIGEMEAARTQKSFLGKYLFSIEAWYNYLSKYGTSPLRAIFILSTLILCHSFITWLIIPHGSFVLQQMRYCINSSELMYLINTICGLLHNSLKVITIQKFEPFISYSAGLNLLNTIFRVLGPIQIALIVLALRGKVKRH